MNETLTILGSAGALPTLKRNPSAHALSVEGRSYLIDCAEGTQLQMRRFGLKMLAVKAIFITHLHGDHFFGLPGLVSTMHLQGRTKPLTLVGPPGLKPVLEMVLSHARSDLSYELLYKEVDTEAYERVYEDEKVEVYSLPLEHRLPTCGYLFRRPQEPRKIRREYLLTHTIPIAWFPRLKAGEDFVDAQGRVVPNGVITEAPAPPWSYAYCSDTRFTEAIVPYLQGVDLLYHEATYGDDRLEMAARYMHSTARQAATIAQRAGVKKLIIGHFSSRYRDISPLLEQAREVFPATEAAEDGMVLK
ncbi:MAG: ribonuclease Z [Bacteroidetes bacterium]|nr:MAG: ribonuclease Z [Bacteroidota bacterium]